MKDHDENLDEEIDQQDKQVYEHIDKPSVLELFPRKHFFLHHFKLIFKITHWPIIIKMTSKEKSKDYFKTIISFYLQFKCKSLNMINFKCCSI